MSNIYIKKIKKNNSIFQIHTPKHCIYSTLPKEAKSHKKSHRNLIIKLMISEHGNISFTDILHLTDIAVEETLLECLLSVHNGI